MSRARALVLALIGLALPAGLALAIYLTSAGDLGAAPAVVSIPSPQIAVPVEQETTTAETTTGETTTGETTTGSDDDDREEREIDDDLPGKCKDPKHRLDPDCDPRTAGDDDSSGSGSGSDDDSSGKGSGDDD